jgi:hypothetical protein
MEVLDGRASEWHIARSTATLHEEEGRDVTVIVSVKINDGIIMASDSASTFAIWQTYLTADKIVNLVLPIGIMVTGNGNIGTLQTKSGAAG